MALKEHMPAIEKKWLRNNIFCSPDSGNGQSFTVVMDSGSSYNIFSQALVGCLKMRVHKTIDYILFDSSCQVMKCMYGIPVM